MTTSSPPSYNCYHARTTPIVDGIVSGVAWDSAVWSDPFVDIEDGNAQPTRALPLLCDTRVKMLWDDTYLYIGAYMSDPHVWATLTVPNSVIFMDNDFEVFLDPNASGTNYYELEVNALGTVWQLSLDKPYSLGGTATSPCELEGLKVAVHVDGTLNNPTDVDQGWSVTLAIPFASLTPFGANAPPNVGDVWRVNFSRVHWPHTVEDGQYVRVPPHGIDLPQGADQWHPERNIVWAPTGVLDIHKPELWGSVTFMR